MNVHRSINCYSHTDCIQCHTNAQGKKNALSRVWRVCSGQTDQRCARCWKLPHVRRHIHTNNKTKHMPCPSNRNYKSLHIVELNARLDEVGAGEKKSPWFTKSKCAKLAISPSFCWFSFGICVLCMHFGLCLHISVQAFVVASQAWMIYKLSGQWKLSTCRAIALKSSNYSIRPPKWKLHEKTWEDDKFKT